MVTYTLYFFPALQFDSLGRDLDGGEGRDARSHKPKSKERRAAWADDRNIGTAK